jgi:acetylglutamate kinase
MHNLNNHARPIVVKYGGNAMGSATEDDPVLAELAKLHRAGTQLVLVHGGGPEIDRWLAARGVETHRVDGLRVTDEVTLEVTEAVLCGTLNKRLVRALDRLGCRAAGISGEDARTLVAHPISGSHGEDLGFVGGNVMCHPGLVQQLVAGGMLPVIAPLAIAHSGDSALNVNADSAAAAIAGGVSASAFLLLTNVNRVRRDPNDPDSGIDQLTVAEAEAFAATPACSGGMLPKIEAAIHAVTGGADYSVIGEAGPDSIARALAGSGTRIVPNAR